MRQTKKQNSSGLNVDFSDLKTVLTEMEHDILKKYSFEFTKVRPVKSPVRGTKNSAGIDFFIPDDFVEIQLRPNCDILIPSGIKVLLPVDHCLLLCNKSGVATKLKLVSGAELIDEDYRGEVHIHLFNFSHGITILRPGMKIIQGILIPTKYFNIREVATEAELYAGALSDRGQGGFGSTDKK